MNSIFWIGKYESDIEDSNFFIGSITYYGSNKENNYSFCNNKIRINAKLAYEFKYFVCKKIKKLISRGKNYRFMFYNQCLAHEIISLFPECESYIIGINSFSLINTLNNKLYNRLWFSTIFDIIPVKIFAKNECTYKNIKNSFHDYTSFIIQKNISSGGKGTYLLTSDSEDKVFAELEDAELYIVSPYINNSYSINFHICITDEGAVKLPPSIQISKLIGNKLLFCGSDYMEAKNISREVYDQINKKLEEAGNLLTLFGYRGVLGIDLMITEKNVYFIEINPRFQGSSLPLNKCLIDSGLPSLYELHLKAFENKISKEEKVKLENLSINYSVLIYNKFLCNDNVSELFLKMKNNPHLFRIYPDGYNPTMQVDFNAYFFRVLIKETICYINPDKNLNVAENLIDIAHLKFPIKSTDEIITLKISLLVQGVILSKEAYNYISRKNSIKDATFNAIDVSIFNGLKVNCPINIPFSDLSPFHIEYDSLNKLQLYYKEYFVSNIVVDTNENLLDRKTKSGIPYSKIGFMTNDRVRIRHTSVCYFKENSQSCIFCESKNNQKYDFLDSDIYEVIDAYEKEVNFRHYLIGGASEKSDLEPETIKRIIRHIRKKSSKPIYLMSLPPENISHIYDYYQLGLNEVAFNIEVFDRTIAAELMPGKGKIPLSQYFNALEESTKYFGKSGNVRSMLILGLEKEDSFLEGLNTLCALGVSPMISIFRPMPSTTMNHIIPPTIENIKKIYDISNDICKKYNTFLGPSCAQCQNNTLSLPVEYLEIG